MYFEIKPLSDVRLTKIFSHSVVCYFVLLMVSFALQKLFSFIRSHLLIVNLSTHVICVPFRKLSPVPMCSKLFLFLIYLVQCIWIYVEDFDLLGLEIGLWG